MSGISSDVFFAVIKIKTTFANSIGESHCGVGTGFWISDATNGENIFVTNKHNVNYNFQKDVFGFDLKKVEIEFRKSREGEDGYRYLEGAPDFFEVNNVGASLKEHTDADCAIFYNPTFLNKDENHRLAYWVKFEEIADQNFLKDKVAPLDNVSFIGFPGEEWEDTMLRTPIGRYALISSFPHLSFNNGKMKSTDITLVTGLSFNGSSGSPVILNQKSFKANPDYVPPKLIGIMSGHWSDKDKDEHSGISYYTRSTSLLSLIENARTPIVQV